jgi:sugar porter (SP) family MFS transporter
MVMMLIYTVFGGAFFGVIVIYWLNERFGRRVALILSGMIFNIGTIFQIVCNGNVGAFYAGRIVAGLGVGGISFVVPQYLSECSPAIARGAVVGAYEIFLQLGTVVGFWINYGVNLHVAPTDKQWHIPVAIQFIPGSIMAIGLLFLCESPRWLYIRERKSDAIKALTWVRNLPADHPFVEMEISDFERQMEHERTIASGASLKSLMRETFSPQVRFRVFIGCMLMIFQNSTGINAMNSYSVTFFGGLGFKGTTASLFSTGIYGAIKAGTTIISFFFFVDRLGRRKLLFIGSIGVVFSLYYVAGYAAVSGSFTSTRDPDSGSYSGMAFLYIYGAAYVSVQLFLHFLSLSRPQYSTFTGFRVEHALGNMFRNLPHAHSVILPRSYDMFALGG